MIKSMTGASRTTISDSGYNLEIVIKSLNSKQCDVFVKAPKIIAVLEPEIISQIKQKLSRGKIAVFITIENSSQPNIIINRKAVDRYIQSIKEIASDNNISNDTIDFYSLLRLPECVSSSKISELPVLLKNLVFKTLANSIEELDKMRLTEGNNILISVNNTISDIESRIKDIQTALPESIENYKVKLKNIVSEILQEEKDFEKKIIFELGIFADKVDINEEIVRLDSHINQLKKLISPENTMITIGRTVEFLLQEMNREINTSSVKSQSSIISKKSVEIKSLLDKLKEHSTNIV